MDFVPMDDQTKTKEQWLREELRATRSLLLHQMFWGATALAAAAINIYYIRIAARVDLIKAGALTADEPPPFGRWVIGTFYLCLLAAVFIAINRQVGKQHIGYRRQLIEMNGGYSGIKETVPLTKYLWLTPFLLFLSIPTLDLIIWAWFHVKRYITFSFFW